MAWTNELDPTTPSDLDPAGEGDDHLRQIKAGIEERMQSRMPGWPEDDPLRLQGADVGAIGDRPATPIGDGEIYIAHTPEKRVYYGFGGAWHEIQAAALIGALVRKIEVSDSVELALSSPQTAVGLPLDVAENEEVISWRIRWRFPDFSVDWVGWTYSAASINYGSSNPYTDAGTLVGLLFCTIDKEVANFHFENRDTDPHVVDVELVAIVLQVEPD